jgi:hypothetical protein
MSDFLAPPGITRAGLDAAATALQQDANSAFRAAQNATFVPTSVVQKYGKPDASRAFLQSKLEAINAASGRVGVLGDSITEGNANGGYPWYNEWKTLYPNITFVNYGHGGKTTGDFVSTYMGGIVADTACALYVVALGCNDVRYVNDVGTTGATTGAAFAANLATITGQLTPRGSVVVVNPWFTTVKDYKQELATAAKEKAYWEYDRAAQSAMAALGIPYIQTTALNYSWYKDLLKATSWAVDGVHPDQAHTKVYARLVLFGAVPREEVIDSPQKAAQPYVYRLEILSRAPGDTSDRVWLKTLSATPAPTEIYGSSNRAGFMDPTVLTAAYNNGSVGYVNLDGDYPFNITWSSATELQSLSYLPDAARKGIGNYRLWVSRDLESIGQPDHASWRLLENGIRARPAAGTFQRMLYSRGRAERYFYKLAFTSMFSGDTAIEVTALTFPSNSGLDGVMAYNVSGADKTTQDIAQMFQQNSRSTTFTTTPSGVMVATHVPIKLFNITFATGKRADGWALYQSTESGALEDFNHSSWQMLRSGLFGGSQSLTNVDTRYQLTRHAAYTTAARPTASSVGAGAAYYDTTLGKPAWSDGTNWKDAAGTTV